MFGLKWLMDHGVLPKDRLEEYYASYVAGIFRTVRFGTGEAHGRAEMMEFNYLVEQGAIVREGGTLRGRLREDPRRRSRSSRRSCSRWKRPAIARAPRRGSTKYDKMPPDL